MGIGQIETQQHHRHQVSVVRHGRRREGEFVLHPGRSAARVPAVLSDRVATTDQAQRQREDQPCSSSMTQPDPRVLTYRVVLQGVARRDRLPLLRSPDSPNKNGKMLLRAVISWGEQCSRPRMSSACLLLRLVVLNATN